MDIIVSFAYINFVNKQNFLIDKMTIWLPTGWIQLCLVITWIVVQIKKHIWVGTSYIQQKCFRIPMSCSPHDFTNSKLRIPKNKTSMFNVVDIYLAPFITCSWHQKRKHEFTRETVKPLFKGVLFPIYFFKTLAFSF